MSLRYSALIIGVVALCVSCTSIAAEFVTKKRIEPNRIAELKPVLDEEMSPGGRFESVDPNERARIHRALDEMEKTVAGKESLADLDEDERVELFNLQEQVNAILLKRDNDRVVCTRRPLPGSHRKESVCETVGERAARQRYSRDRMNELNKRVQMCQEIDSPGTDGLNGGGGGIVCQSG